MYKLLSIFLLGFTIFAQGQSINSNSVNGNPHNICPEVLPGQNRLTLYPKRIFSTSTDPYVPQYPYGGVAYGPFVDINGFSPVNPFGNHYAAYPAPPVNATTAQIIQTAIGQVREVQLDSEREFASGSLVWTDAWTSTNIGIIYDPTIPDFQNQVISAVGHYASQVTIRPTVTTVAEGPLSGGVLDDLYIGFNPKGFDSQFANMASSTYGCTMPRYAVSSVDCPLVSNGQFSQGRVDWNKFVTSTTLPLHATNNITQDLQQEFKCLKSLLGQADGTFRNVALIRVTIVSLDDAAETEFLNAYKAELALNSPNWKPALIVEKGVHLLDPQASIGISIEEALIGNPSDVLKAYNNEDVYSLPDVYSQVVQTPVGWAYTAQMFPTVNRIDEPLQLTSSGSDFYFALNPVDPGLRASLSAFKPGEPVQGSIYADWVAQGVQVNLNIANVLATIGLDISDVTYQYNVQGPQGFILPLFAISDASTIVFNGTEGNSGFNLPQRDETVIASVPTFGGAQQGFAGYDATVISSRFVAIDYQNFKAPANNNGATPGITSYLVCNGFTDIVSCPKNLRKNLGAQAQAINAFYPHP